MDHKTGKEDDKQNDQQHHPQAEQRDPFYQPQHFLAVPGTDGVAHQRAGGGAQGMRGNGKDGIEATHNIGNRQRPLPHVILYEEEKKHPGAYRKQVLCHHENGDIEDFPDHRPLKTDGGEAIRVRIGSLVGVKDKEEGRAYLCYHRSDGRPGDPHLRHAQVAEYQSVVEQHIDQCHHHRIECQNLRTGDADIEGTEHYIGEGKKKSEDTPHQVIRHRTRHLLRGEHGREPVYRGIAQQWNQQQRGDQQEEDPLDHDLADLVVVPLAIPPPNEDLAPHAEAKAKGVDGNIDDPGQGRSTQLHLAHAAKKGGVNHLNEILRQQTQQDWRTDLDNLFVAVHPVMQKKRRSLTLPTEGYWLIPYFRMRLLPGSRVITVGTKALASSNGSRA